MPFKSKAQRRFLYAARPELAKEWESVTPKNAKLPEKTSKKKSPNRLAILKKHNLVGQINRSEKTSTTYKKKRGVKNGKKK